jgi:tripartite ATP-independent transporter DctP family solute receptor
LAASAALALALGQTALAGTYRITFANYFGPSSPNTKVMEFFKEQVEREGKGAFAVTLKPNNEAGGEEKIMELVKFGTLQIAMVGGLIKDDEPMIGGWEQSFIIDGWEHAKKVFLDPGFTKFAGKYTEKTKVYIKGIVVNGFREVSCNFPVRSMEDFGRMKIRTPLMETYIAIFKGLGANPTPMPMTELYTAMETKVVDGQDNPYSTVKNMKWYEVQKFILESRHVFSPTSVLVNGKFYDGLPAELKTVFDNALSAAIKYGWELAEQDENECIDFLKAQGVEIIIPDAKFKQQMRDSQKDAYAWFDANIPGAKEFRDFCASKR